ncbi:MAG: sodium-translocating pyrophosphatase [Chloroflexi bacterium]|nr:sodium-translocating pyrophosphatase [Ardenticatenaceae bacterium]MBL1128206.1 sodium-translocating pyrophosphatase [Chloroflexota bacterium]NOG34279.1 sodium-translocating pyrophosphatase [Chloroflexota bacterium]
MDALYSTTAQNTTQEPLPFIWWLGLVGALVALFFAWYFYQQVMKESEGNDKMKEIAQAVREGAMAYLSSQYRVVALVFVALLIIFSVMAFLNLQNPIVPVAFITGGFFSALCGFFGMKTATNASARTAHAASKSLDAGLKVALRAGAVMGLVVVGFALLDISLWFLILYYLLPSILPNGGFIMATGNPLPIITATMLSFGMGASTYALFARVGGGIYTKAADVGADLVGKVEAGIPEDDPRNPATIADNVGDNVGDVAGMGADLYESYAGSILATSALGVAAVTSAGAAFAVDAGMSVMQLQLRYITAPMALAAVGVFLSILAIYLVRTEEGADQGKLIGALSRGLYVSSVGIAVLAIPILYILDIPNIWPVFISIIVGLAVGMVIGKSTEYYTSHANKPTRAMAEQANTSTATLMIEGLSVGMESTGIPVFAIVVGIAVSFYTMGGLTNISMGLYGVGIAAVAMLSTLGFTLATDAYGPIADNAGGNAEMSGLDPAVRNRTDQLDAVGNTTAAIGKGFAIGSAALTAMALLSAYLEEVRLALVLHGDAALTVDGVNITNWTMQNFMDFYNVTILNPAVLIGVMTGAATAFYFSSMTMRAVGRAAGGMVEEVRRQFREKPGILEGTERPDYARCVEISTRSAQKEMVAPSLLAIAVPVIVGVLFGVAGVLGLLAGTLTAGFALAVMMSNAGGAWDNAKKYIEEGHYGGKGSPAHKAAVVGDTVGDPFKDTSGPSLNILIKLMAMASVVFAGLVTYLADGQGLVAVLFGG